MGDGERPRRLRAAVRRRVPGGGGALPPGSITHPGLMRSMRGG
eukprot:gene20850-2728_t